MHFGFLNSKPQWNFTFKRIKEYTQTIDSRWKIPGYDRLDSLSTAEIHLKELLLSLSSQGKKGEIYHYIDRQNRVSLSAPTDKRGVLVINCESFPSEGPESISRFIIKAYRKSWKNFITFNWRGQRFCGCGLGSRSNDVHIDVYGSSGDYLASGLDGAEIIVHESVQDQVGQTMKSGKLVI